ncbi:helix-turn-helix domain-containing protein [Thalassotalea atypica]|uniref:helix-turn-helix domain-containing protein n=1 Tax=Thalassotalea atypica TaxID=2054316 RepID=UPI00257412B3|nr:helix-turn-helix domain-containing protein [Thalassotalea atypica]
MTLDSQLLLIVSAFGALNGFVVSGYVFVTSKRQASRQFLALMLLMISVRIFKSVLFFFNPEVDKLILQIGLSACFLIGPFLFFYVTALREQPSVLPMSWRLHLLGLFTLLIAVGSVFPYTGYPELWGSVIYKAVNYIWFVYILLSLMSIKPYLSKLLTKKRKELTEDEILLLCVLVGNVVIWLAYYTASYTSYIVGALSFSFVFLVSLILAFFKFNRGYTPNKAKYGDHKIEDKEVNDGLSKLAQLMTEQKLFNNPNITMPQIAKRIGMSSPKFSQLLNEKLNKSFSVYINELRVAQAKQALVEQPRQKVDDIAEQCGFNSSSTFYSVFKKHTDLTPANYRTKYTPK